MSNARVFCRQLAGLMSLGKVSQKSAAVDSELLADLPGAPAMVIEQMPGLLALRRAQRRQPSQTLALRACDRHACAGAFADQVVLELGQRGHHVEYQPAARG